MEALEQPHFDLRIKYLEYKNTAKEGEITGMYLVDEEEH
jgi:hypothetical protein